MRLLSKTSDGGPDSGVTAYFLVEIKPLFSIVLLHFKGKSREAYHEHAFNALTIWLKGSVWERHLDGRTIHFAKGDIKYTPRTVFHKILPVEPAWALSFRGPWKSSWREYRAGRMVHLTHGRKELREID